MTDPTHTLAPIPETWPMEQQTVNSWALDAASFVALIQKHPTLWHQSNRMKYLTVHIDTRDGGFTLKDRHGAATTADEVLAIIRATIKKEATDDA